MRWNRTRFHLIPFRSRYACMLLAFVRHDRDGRLHTVREAVGVAKRGKTGRSVPLESELLACIGRLLAEGANCDVSWQVVDGDLEARISVFGHSTLCLED